MAKLLPVLVLMAALASSASLAVTTKDPELKQCLHQCKSQRELTEEQYRRCAKSCEEYHKMNEDEERGEERHYVFDEQHFDTRVETEQGSVWELPKFTKKSKFLRGIENFRIAVLEANPLSFLTPSHFDAEMLLFVVQGSGGISLIKEKRISYALKVGDIFRIPAGTPFYMVNKHETEKLRVVELLQPTSLPGHFEVFHGIGGEDPESFFTAFSWELLEAAFKVPRDKLERLLKKQKEGSIMKASREQIESLSQHEETTTRIWPFSKGEKSSCEGPFNLFRKNPTYSNSFGRLFEVHHHECSQLYDLNIDVSFANITKGSMVTPQYNSKSTKIAMVLEGQGEFQMACPHISSKGGRRGGDSYEKVRGRLRRGTVFVVPSGHPFSAYASQSHNLEIVCFEVNSQNNTKYLLAGKDNIVDKMESTAKEMGFNTPAKEVERMFRQQEEEFFFPGPTTTQERGWAFA